MGRRAGETKKKVWRKEGEKEEEGEKNKAVGGGMMSAEKYSYRRPITPDNTTTTKKHCNIGMIYIWVENKQTKKNKK